MLSVGADSTKFPGAPENGPLWTLQRAAALGLDGIFFRSVFDLSPSLDRAEMADVAQAAADLGLYLEAGTGKINPFASPATPEVRQAGDGDYILGLERMIQAAAAVGITELWTATANYQFKIKGLLACDRFRTDVEWEDQLAATAKVMHLIAPVLRDTGTHLNLETHEEITSFEVVRLVEEAGPDAFGITLDTANVLVRGEDPTAATRRVAPYVRMTHIRDAIVVPTESGLGRFLAPVGAGVLDWTQILTELQLRAPRVNLSIEGVTKSRAEMTLHINDARWIESHTDLTPDEHEHVMKLAQDYAAAAAEGSSPQLADLRQPLKETDPLDFILSSAASLRSYLDRLTGPLRDSSTDDPFHHRTDPEPLTLQRSTK